MRTLCAGVDALRFNLMNNWSRFREKVDVWMIRFSTEATSIYWGVTNMTPGDANRVFKLVKVCARCPHHPSPCVLSSGIGCVSAGQRWRAFLLWQGLWLLGGSQEHATDFLARFPEAMAANPVLIPLEQMAAQYNRNLNVTDAAPSSGFAGARALPRPRPCEVGFLVCSRCPPEQMQMQPDRMGRTFTQASWLCSCVPCQPHQHGGSENPSAHP
jgi:hypothetical protein